jgi:hypothetical protein
MIVYHKNNEIDREQWDNCIKNSPGVKPYAYSWFLDIMAPGWEALVDDDYDSVFPVTGAKRFGIQYISTPSFLQQLGAFSPDNPASETIIEFLNYIPDNYRLIDLCIAQRIQLHGYKITEKANFELDISKPYEKLWDNFFPPCKRNIEISSKKKPEVVSDITPDEIIDLYIKNNGKKTSNVKARDYQKLKNIMNFCLKNKKGKIIGVRAAKKRLIFGIFIIETPGNKTLLLHAGIPQSIEKKIDYYVINELIRLNASTRTLLDFADSSLSSVDSFPESFGCVSVPYYRIYRNRLFWPARIMR